MRGYGRNDSRGGHIVFHCRLHVAISGNMLIADPKKEYQVACQVRELSPSQPLQQLTSNFFLKFHGSILYPANSKG